MIAKQIKFSEFRVNYDDIQGELSEPKTSSKSSNDRGSRKEGESDALDSSKSKKASRSIDTGKKRDPAASRSSGSSKEKASIESKSSNYRSRSSNRSHSSNRETRKNKNSEERISSPSNDRGSKKHSRSTDTESENFTPGSFSNFAPPIDSTQIKQGNSSNEKARETKENQEKCKENLKKGLGEIVLVVSEI